MNFPDYLPLESFGLDAICVINRFPLLNPFFLLDGQFGEEPACLVYTAFCHLINIMDHSTLVLEQCPFLVLFCALVLLLFQGLALHDLVNEAEVVLLHPRLIEVA